MLLLRRVYGDSMLPVLAPGRIVVAVRFMRNLREGDIVIVRHESRDKIKRVERISLDKIYIVGDNRLQSTDSRHFGWIDRTVVQGKIIWPRNTDVRQKSQQ